MTRPSPLSSASRGALVLPSLMVVALGTFAALKAPDLWSTRVLLTVAVIYLSSFVLIQLAQWKAPLWGHLSRRLDARPRLDLHRALTQSAILAAFVPAASLICSWLRGPEASLSVMVQLACLSVAMGSLVSWLHHRAGLAHLHTIDDARKRLSYAVGGWRSATALNLLLHFALWGFVWLQYSGGPSLYSDVREYVLSPRSAVGLELMLVAGLLAGLGQDRALRRLLSAHAVGLTATVIAMIELWGMSQGQANPVPIALFWTGTGVLVSAVWAGPEKGMFKPVGDIKLPLPFQLSTADRLRVLAAGVVLFTCWHGAGLPWIDLAAVAAAVIILTLNRVRQQRLEHLLNGQTQQLRKDKAKVEELNQVLAESFSKFVPRDIVDELVAEGQLTRLRGEEREVTILFSDIRGYSTIIETLPPIRVLKVLNLYFSSMEKVIDRHEGTILEYVGDAILAVFGAPGDLDGHALAAARCAVEMREALAEFNAEMERQGLSDTWRDQGYDELGARIGIHKGHVVAGTLGGTNQVRYSVLGDTVNVAARLEAYNKELGTEILISDAVFDALGSEFRVEATDHGPVVLKGRSAEQHCYSL